MEWPKPSSARSSVTMSASVRVRMQTPSCSSYQFGSLTTTRFTRTRHSDLVHPVSSSQLTEARDRVRSFGGYNSAGEMSSDAIEFCGAVAAAADNGMPDAEACLDRFDLEGLYGGCCRDWCWNSVTRSPVIHPH